ncbi:MAG: SWIM zinc finger family protein [Planctomycetota bacterium]
MSGPAIAYSYLYPFQSQIGKASDSRASANSPTNGLQLATFTEQDVNPYFFQGELLEPFVVAKLLQTLVHFVRAKFHDHLSVTLRALADPIITAHEDFLRFEVFSGCCSVYARVDLPPESIRGQTLGCGTTNVDFNPGMVAALGKVRASDKLSVAVGADEFVLENLNDQVHEKKVQLPLRWLKGLAAVTSYGEKLQCQHEIQAAHAARFLRSLPRTPDKRSRWHVQKAGVSLRISQRNTDNAVEAGGLHRLRALEDLVRFAQSLRVYGSSDIEASGWELDCGKLRISLIMTHDVWRGFSGEGQGLEAMAVELPKNTRDAARALLKWQSVVDPSTTKSKLSANDLLAGLANLSSQGKVGFDISAGHYFHRELPFDLEMVAKLQPRLQGAQKLLEKNWVQPKANSSNDFEVKSTDTTHLVHCADDMTKCTCPWFAKHQNLRGPCKHILAVQMYINQFSDPAEP